MISLEASKISMRKMPLTAILCTNSAFKYGVEERAITKMPFQSNLPSELLATK